MFLELFESYLAAGRAVVLVQGASSEQFGIANQIFQGTVLGPHLWNLFFADIDDALCVDGCECDKFAGDLTVSKVFPLFVNET